MSQDRPRLYVLELEAEIARLEQDLRAAETLPYAAPEQDQATGPTDEAVVMELLTGNPSPLSVHSESLIENLLSSTDAKEKVSVQSLIDDIGQASLSAMVVPETTSSHDFYLRPLILNATLPVNPASLKSLPKPLHLPQKSIAEKVFFKFRHTVLPDLPLMIEDAVYQHLQATYQSNAPAYSVFVTALMLATTAVHLSPSSVDRACNLHRAAVLHLETAFTSASEPQPLRDLEAAVGLAYYAALTGEDYSDAWALSGIAMRICVDLGLHKFADTNQKRRLFWSAFALDRKVAVTRELPLGLPDKTISADFPSSTSNPFKLYMFLSELYCMQRNPDIDRCHDIRLQLDDYLRSCRFQRQPSNHFERDVELTTRLLAQMTGGVGDPI
ncbi:hypothetical protein PV11_04283 [Exophiala sideris]|uniref:Xylanolytic transcriptional activator regulatory domain-containing protein n=1 Tax=Exophiala sideris TaxID=1016849 RepID=A0A0D1W0B3_9EURO|nr:hypothetical protein PV11_04283 [Exophiala sideris]